jgi:hypothetical protein
MFGELAILKWSEKERISADSKKYKTVVEHLLIPDTINEILHVAGGRLVCISTRFDFFQPFALCLVTNTKIHINPTHQHRAQNQRPSKNTSENLPSFESLIT